MFHIEVFIRQCLSPSIRQWVLDTSVYINLYPIKIFHNLKYTRYCVLQESVVGISLGNHKDIPSRTSQRDSYYLHLVILVEYDRVMSKTSQKSSKTQYLNPCLRHKQGDVGAVNSSQTLRPNYTDRPHYITT